MRIIQNTLCYTTHGSLQVHAFLPTQRTSLRPAPFPLAMTAEGFELSQGRPQYPYLGDSTSATGVMQEVKQSHAFTVPRSYKTAPTSTRQLTIQYICQHLNKGLQYLSNIQFSIGLFPLASQFRKCSRIRMFHRTCSFKPEQICLG